LIDKASKLLAISETEVTVLATEIVVTPSKATKKESNLPLVIPAAKKIKVEPGEVTVEALAERGMKDRIKESQGVWTTFHNTRIQLYADDKLMIENGLVTNMLTLHKQFLEHSFPSMKGCKTLSYKTN